MTVCVELDKATVFDSQTKENQSIAPLVLAANLDCNMMTVELATPFPPSQETGQAKTGQPVEPSDGVGKIFLAHKPYWDRQGVNARYLPVDDQGRPMNAYGGYINYADAKRHIRDIFMFPRHLVPLAQDA